MKSVSISFLQTRIVELLPGVTVAAILAFFASWISGGLGDPLARNPVLVAMLFGLLIGNLFDYPQPLKPGLDFTKRQLLRLAVVLVGFRITTSLFVQLGVTPLAIAGIELTIVLISLRWIGERWLGLDRELALLIAAGSAVCGAAAILSVAALTRARDKHAGIAIVLITLTGTAALTIYPIAFINNWLPRFDEHQYGVFVGSSIYELAQVYGASFSVSEGALNTATLVKLSKVLMLIPVLLVINLFRRQSNVTSHSIHPPWFIGAFIVVLLFNSTISLHPQLRKIILGADQFLFLMVMVALGVTTKLSEFRNVAITWRLVSVGFIGLLLSSSIAFALTSFLFEGNIARVSSAESAMFRSVGGRIFSEIGCAKCHVPSLRGINGDVILFSDLLLHDMGPALDDKIAQGTATGAEWRTAPLVGLRLRSRYLHDGRADNLRNAIQAHGGESERVRNRYLELNDTDKQAIINFLGTL